jgi:hypothetical protein
MGNKLMVQYAAEAQAGTNAKSEKQLVSGGNYAAQAQLDYRASRDIGSSSQSDRRCDSTEEFAFFPR